jgi:hypothetical protein
MKSQMIKAFLIGIGITAFGGVMFFVLICFYSDLDGHRTTILEDCLDFLMRAAWFPLRITGSLFLSDGLGGFGVAVGLVVTALFWGLAILSLWQVKKLMKRVRKTPKQ